MIHNNDLRTLDLLIKSFENNLYRCILNISSWNTSYKIIIFHVVYDLPTNCNLLNLSLDVTGAKHILTFDKPDSRKVINSRQRRDKNILRVSRPKNISVFIFCRCIHTRHWEFWEYLNFANIISMNRTYHIYLISRARHFVYQR